MTDHIHGRIPRRRVLVLAGDGAVLLPREALAAIDAVRGRHSAQAWIAATLLRQARADCGQDPYAPITWRGLALLAGARV